MKIGGTEFKYDSNGEVVEFCVQSTSKVGYTIIKSRNSAMSFRLSYLKWTGIELKTKEDFQNFQVH